MWRQNSDYAAYWKPVRLSSIRSLSQAKLQIPVELKTSKVGPKSLDSFRNPLSPSSNPRLSLQFLVTPEVKRSKGDSWKQVAPEVKARQRNQEINTSTTTRKQLRIATTSSEQSKHKAKDCLVQVDRTDLNASFKREDPSATLHPRISYNASRALKLSEEKNQNLPGYEATARRTRSHAGTP